MKPERKEKSRAPEENLRKKKKKSGRLYRICHAIFAGILKLIFHIKVVGRENEPKEGGYIVCANHTAASDPVVIGAVFHRHQICYMAKKELFGIPVFSSLIRILGAFPVDRTGNDVGAIRQAVSLLECGGCLGIFPQGHRYPGENPRDTRVKNGAALIAVRAHADVVPVYIMRKNNTPKFWRKTYVIIGEKIPFAELGYDSGENAGEYARITGILFDRVCTLGENFSAEREKKQKGAAK